MTVQPRAATLAMSAAAPRRHADRSFGVCAKQGIGSVAIHSISAIAAAPQPLQLSSRTIAV